MLNSKAHMTKTPKGVWTIDQPTINGWQTSYNPDTDSVCAHAGDGSIAFAFSMTNKRGEPSRRGWDNLLYQCRHRQAPVYDPECVLEQGQYEVDIDGLLELLE